jgi:hypothetical protein
MDFSRQFHIQAADTEPLQLAWPQRNFPLRIAATNIRQPQDRAGPSEDPRD